MQCAAAAGRCEVAEEAREDCHAVIVGATRVVKKLGPAQPGALRWARRHGAALISLRYRLAADGQRRYTTVDLLVDEAPTQRHRLGHIVGVRAGIGEVELRTRIKAAGGRWDPTSKLWRIARRHVRAPGLDDRVMEE